MSKLQIFYMGHSKLYRTLKKINKNKIDYKFYIVSRQKANFLFYIFYFQTFPSPFYVLCREKGKENISYYKVVRQDPYYNFEFSLNILLFSNYYVCDYKRAG